MEERAVVAQTGICRIQFPRSTQCKSKKRGQMPFAVDRRDVIRERLLEYVAKGEVAIPEKEKDTLAANTVTQLSIFGCHRCQPTREFTTHLPSSLGGL